MVEVEAGDVPGRRLDSDRGAAWADSRVHGDYCPGSLLFTKLAAEKRIFVTYKPGDTVPRDGTVQCTQYHGTKDKVKKGTKFAPCDHWGDHHPKGCTWQYA